MTDYKNIQTKVNTFIEKVNKLGTVKAEKNFTCCQSCGHAEMEDTPNYIFYHQQTGESMKETNSCFFSHHFKDDCVREQVKIIAQSFGSSWDGSNNQTIEINL